MTKMDMLKFTYLLFTVLALTPKESRAMIRDCDLGAVDYKTVLKSECFFDKSLLIKTFLSTKMQKSVTFVTTPRRFGKTVNMDMIKKFLEIQDGRIAENLTENCNLFKNYSLNIYNYKNHTFFNANCGRYPVIYINLTSLTGTSFEDIFDGFKCILHETFLQHKYLETSSRLNNDQKQLLSYYITTNVYILPEDKIHESVYHLSKCLYLHFHKEVVILIDDYDAPYWRMLNNSFPKAEVLKTTEFLYNFTCITLNNNSYIDRVLINACLRLSSSTVVAENRKDYPFLGNHPLVEYYGLTAEEIKKKFKCFNLKFRTLHINRFYGGYSAPDQDIEMRKMWSVMKYIEREKLKVYFTDPEVVGDLKEFLRHGILKDIIQKAIKLEIIRIRNVYRHSLNQSYNEIIILKDLIAQPVTLNRNHVETFIHFMLDYGYFIEITNDPDTLCLKIPNKEMVYHFRKIFKSLRPPKNDTESD